MEGSSSGTLRIGASYYSDYSVSDFDCDLDSDELRTLDGKMLSFQNLRFLTQLIIAGCRNLTSISFKGLSQLISLKSLEIAHCKELFSSHVLPEHIHEDMAAADCNALPSLERLCIESCGITGKWLSVMLRHVQALEELILEDCLPMVEEEENSRSNLVASAYPNDELISSALLPIPLNVISSLKKIYIEKCPDLTFYGSKDGFAGFTSLLELYISGCPKLLPSSVHKDGRWILPQSLGELQICRNSLETLQPCFPDDLTCLKKLEVRWSPSLKSLQLHSCTALEELAIQLCESLDSIEGLQSLGALRHLKVLECPGLPPCFENLSSQGCELCLCPRLETLEIDDPSALTSSFCKHLTSLQQLCFWWGKGTRLTDDQERALQLLASLKELQFVVCLGLVDLPAGLHSLPNLKRLLIYCCKGISRLPEKGLPPPLEELQIDDCREELAHQCRKLATSKLKVKIDGKYVN